jgi:hypothetical protein
MAVGVIIAAMLASVTAGITFAAILASMAGGVSFAGTLFSEDSIEQPGAMGAIRIRSKNLVFVFIINAPYS